MTEADPDPKCHGDHENQSAVNERNAKINVS